MYKSAEIASRIKLIAKGKGVVIGTMLADIHLGANTMANLKTSMPKADNLAKIADYLDCSVDYLLGRVDYPELGIKKAPHDGDAMEHNIIRLAGRDGRYIEKELTPEQIDLFFKMLDQLPDGDYL